MHVISQMMVSFFFLEKGQCLSPAWNSLSGLECLAMEPRGLGPFSPVLGIQPHTSFFNVGSRNQTRVLVLVQQVLYGLGYLSPTAILFSTLWICLMSMYYSLINYTQQTQILRGPSLHWGNSCRHCWSLGPLWKTSGTECWLLKIHKTILFWKTQGIGRRAAQLWGERSHPFRDFP